MSLDMSRIAQIIDEYVRLDPLEAYYRKNDIPYSRVAEFPCVASDIIKASFSSELSVLDVGCGDGHTLIQNSSRILHGSGIDDSKYIVSHATSMAAKSNAGNLRFLQAKAIDLPFDHISVEYWYIQPHAYQI
ncbi:MAG: methyltransferase domain-containing protein [Spirochaetales bacterium]|jgi:SAM-dependent methyltransferase|nr:methyltransferase domain-containing protein [Spirochaetales bacterium]